ncbi:hypothetical protein [Microbulbifer spongiae]|uniref:Uncharacterized protein n=1 Tax=Microbulbifer spongiae TaxID=2944933 RepID=A0ABY9EFL1_9GAMM|nr:hypothetical protein [Microbulbifer sp. MI-G]WKD50359.1 hypothetical protein M8T91_02695 [Microbulbifer sp. MI-G]
MQLTQPRFALKLLLSAFFLTPDSALTNTEEGYIAGHGALEVFNAPGFMLTPTWVQVWVCFLAITFIVGFYYARKHPLARWTSGGFILSTAGGSMSFALLGLPFLGGSIAIMHILCWLPGLVLLLIHRPFLDTKEPAGFRIWAGTITGVILFSFIFDIRDAAIYIGHLNGTG